MHQTLAAIGLAVLLASTSVAFSQSAGIDSRCARLRNPQACTCALAIGGRLEPVQGGYRWTYDGRQAPAHAACMRSRFNRQ